MNELAQSFNEYVESFKHLETSDKRKALLESMTDLINVFEKLSRFENISLEYLKKDEIVNLKTDGSEDEYLEALLVYIENAKNIIGQYIDTKI